MSKLLATETAHRVGHIGAHGYAFIPNPDLFRKRRLFKRKKNRAQWYTVVIRLSHEAIRVRDTLVGEFELDLLITKAVQAVSRNNSATSVE